jgi:Type II secretion system (T2SS), protein E, N-terminal domain
MSARLASRLIVDRVLPEATVQAATARQLIYGGTLDTALLEMAVMTEAAIWARLAAATGLPVPVPALCDGSAVEAEPSLTAARTAALRAVPITSDGGTLEILCAEPVAADEIRAAAAERGFSARLYVVPEVRLLALRQRVYGERLPARYAPLLVRIVGAERARKICGEGRPQNSLTRRTAGRPPGGQPAQTRPAVEQPSTPEETLEGLAFELADIEQWAEPDAADPAADDVFFGSTGAPPLPPGSKAR